MTNKKILTKYYHLRVFGCQMNKSDGERIDAVMQKAGYKPTDDEKSANVLIAVACSVRQSPIDRIYGLSGRWTVLKTKTPSLKLILTGCVLEFDRRKLADRFDVIMPITEIGELPKLVTSNKKPVTIGEKATVNYKLSTTLPTGRQVNNTSAISNNYLSIPPKHHSKHSAYVPIMTGCDTFCTYCAVPYVRGREISRPTENIINEVEDLIRQEYKEIILLGENVNNYRSTKTRKHLPAMPCKARRAGENTKTTTDFPALLKVIANIPGKFWIRFVTSNPENFSDELIKVIANEPKICNHIHLPIQAGSNAILKKMNRKYTKEEYLKLIKKIRKAPRTISGRGKIPEVALSTDIIVGFPGETKKQFEETAKVMRDLKFDMAYIAQYSPRPGTAAARMSDDVPHKEKKGREGVLMGILRGTALANNRALIGKILEVLVYDEAVSRKAISHKKMLIGKTESFKNVKFAGLKKLIGEFVNVKITKASEFGLEGELIRC